MALFGQSGIIRLINVPFFLCWVSRPIQFCSSQTLTHFIKPKCNMCECPPKKTLQESCNLWIPCQRPQLPTGLHFRYPQVTPKYFQYCGPMGLKGRLVPGGGKRGVNVRDFWGDIVAESPPKILKCFRYWRLWGYRPRGLRVTYD